MIMRGRRLSVQEAYDWAIVSEVVPDDEPDAAIDRRVDDVTARPQIPLTGLKWVLNSTGDAPLHVRGEMEGHVREAPLRPRVRAWYRCVSGKEEAGFFGYVGAQRRNRRATVRPDVDSDR
jgi:enoyl-CoA hydratase/carnithine racemase